MIGAPDMFTLRSQFPSMSLAKYIFCSHNKVSKLNTGKLHVLGQRGLSNSDSRLLCLCYKGCVGKEDVYVVCPTHEKKTDDIQC